MANQTIPSNGGIYLIKDYAKPIKRTHDITPLIKELEENVAKLDLLHQQTSHVLESIKTGSFAIRATLKRGA